jgi:ABC-type antimicrobial peptide transport system permease subunit
MGERFIVMGVLSEVEESINFNNVDFDNALILNIKNIEELSGADQIQQINVKAANTDSLADVSSAIRDKLKEKKQGDTNFTVAYGDDITHPAGSLFTIVSGMLTLVATISLVVGGIGIMNIMLVSVAERTHEIGIRKAVGASGQNILLQFLFEALILSLLGGFMGLILGYILAFFVSIVTPFAPYISWQILLVTFGTALLVGVIFGIYPALKAASKNPIESLKHYR